ncbi:unnamed protein product [Spirodela intermedia]|uniref:Uncharacterized protein n=1 Tax=Spirodela intermedia TaxID=51605 RepID=A0A7I8ILE1_SPIIN|nr:unnamed protein product [Spirodela intermedia]CAA6658743.1 unnamed protein product [Spirodela intermedia]
MGRSPCCEEGLKKGPWTPEEDQKLLAYIDRNGHGSWRALPAKAGLQRCGKSCRLRWTNYLRPDIKRGKFSLQEEQTIIQLHALLGNRWSAIASHLPKRTDNEIKNFWNTHLKKRLAKMGIDPITHKPSSDAVSATGGGGGGTTAAAAATLSHMAQWESARLEAEARLARESKMHRPSAAAHFQSPAAASFSTSTPIHLQGSSSCPLPTPRLDLESPTSTLTFSEKTESIVRRTAFSDGLAWPGEQLRIGSFSGSAGAAMGSLGDGFVEMLLGDFDRFPPATAPISPAMGERTATTTKKARAIGPAY